MRAPWFNAGSSIGHNFADGATARANTVSKRPARCSAVTSCSNRSTFDNCSSLLTTRKNRIRFAIRSHKVNCRSGFTMAKGVPGNPAPVPISSTDAPCKYGLTLRLSNICRDQRRSMSWREIRLMLRFHFFTNATKRSNSCSCSFVMQTPSCSISAPNWLGQTFRRKPSFSRELTKSTTPLVSCLEFARRAQVILVAVDLAFGATH